MELSKSDLIAIRINQDYAAKSSIDYTVIVEKKIGILLELMETLVEEKDNVEAWKAWTEPLVQKLCTHSVTFLNLYNGTKLPFGQDLKKILVLDQPSILVLLRTIIECYLTCYHLYFDQVSDKEKKFRLAVWRFSGINQRVSFEVNTNEAREKQRNEKVLLNELKEEVVTSNYFSQYNRKQKEDILRGVKPRLFNSWITLIQKSDLRVDLFKNVYGYKSNYSHSEFISILQIKDGILKFKENEEVGFELFLLHFIIAKIILDVAKFFPSIEEKYNTLNEEIKIEIELLNRMARNVADDTNLEQ